MQPNEYQGRIIQYYRESEDAYRDSWDLSRSLAIHYGYRDEQAKTFRASLQRMSEVMLDAAGISSEDHVLDAGCGVGGSSIFLAQTIGCRVTGITLSDRQAELASRFAKERGVDALCDFQVMNYSSTSFPDAVFSVVWGCESICYAEDKQAFVREAGRLLQPGGRLVVADGFTPDKKLNDHPVNRKWLDGWQVNYLETPERFRQFMEEAGFSDIRYRDITKETSHSARRLHRFYFLAKIYSAWMSIKGKKPTLMQKMNIEACKYQFLARKKGIARYGLIVGTKQVIE